MIPKRLAFLDLETTGGSASQDRITEIGIIRVEDGQVTETWQTLLNPQQPIPEYIQQFTGITPTLVADAPLFSEVADQVLSLLQDCVIVAHNVRFDYSFLKHEFERLGVSFQSKHLCTVKLSRTLFPTYERHSLATLIERFNLHCPHHHRAFDDAHVLWQLFQTFISLQGQDKVDEAIAIIMRRPSLPVHLDQAQLDSLPTTPGVYIFYGDTPAPLYIGKSVNIRTRVLSHFTNDLASDKEMKLAQEVRRIEVMPTAGELGALLKESLLIKQMLPVYNRRLRRNAALANLTLCTDLAGFLRVKVERKGLLEASILSQIRAIFSSKKSALQKLEELAERHELCHKMLGLESVIGPCFAYRLGQCRGACVGKETAAEFNQRLENALAEVSLQTWPFAGPIAVREQNQATAQEEFHLFNKWCYLGSTSTVDTVPQVLSQQSEGFFDLDTYSVVKNYLRKGGADHVITL